MKTADTAKAATDSKSPQEWEKVIADLTIKAHNIEAEAAALVKERDALALDAELGSDAAVRRLASIATNLNGKQQTALTVRAAIAQAEIRLEEAREAETAIAEQARQSELRTLASAVLKHATEFTASLRQATEAGAVIKQTIHKMIALSTPVERSSLNQLLEPGPYMRAAEHAGLRAFVEFQGFTGLREHIVSLEAALAVHLGRWLEEQK